MSRWISLAGTLLLEATVRASSQPDLWPQMESNGTGSALILRTVLALVLVLGLIGLLAYVANRLMPRWRRIQSRNVRILETTALGPRRALHVVEFAGNRYLLASTANHVSLIASAPAQSPADEK